MDILLTFPYSGLESELEKIVERRARASDVLSMKVYYSFLYAFHVRQGKMRKAAAVMHEQVIHLINKHNFQDQLFGIFIIFVGSAVRVRGRISQDGEMFVGVSQCVAAGVARRSLAC
jgi:hypothetical protein